ncbi:MAG: YgjV family protein, partial [Clostridia bacterium]|nr:YgjV family protein [Clostridia bacterium]
FTNDGVNGAVSSYLGSIQAIVNFWFTSKNKLIPIWLLCVYALSFIVVNLAVLESPIGILALAATLCFVGCVSSKTGAGYRIWQTANNLLWIVYDILSHSYGPLVTHTVLCLFTVAGILLNDRKRKHA